MLAVKEAQSKAIEMEAASKHIFDDDEGLEIQASVLQNYLMSLEENSVSMGAKVTGDLNRYTPATGILDSGASATFVTSKEKTINRMTHKTQLRTANEQKCYTTHVDKTAPEIGDKDVHLSTLVSPSFGEDQIAVSQRSAKGNKVLFTKGEC